jgi:predicted AlkP superfamily pyrophosphatase or phosphodiesterase
MRDASRGLLLAVLVLLIPSRVAVGADPQPAASDRIVVMISIDGLGGHYLDDPKAPMPMLRELAAKGARAGGMKASVPTVTWPNHATLMTGVHPARHGVVGNNYLDRATGKRVTLIADPIFDQSELVRVPTIYDVAKRAGLKTAAVRWPASRNADTLDWTVPDVGSMELTQKYSTPSLLVELAAADIHLADVIAYSSAATTAPASTTAAPTTDRAAAASTTAAVVDEPRIPRDVVFTNAFYLILRQHRPNLGLLHLADVDHFQHLYGPGTPQAYAAIKIADDCVRQIWDEMQRQFPGRATIVIVSDHGFSAIERMLYPNVLLRKAGLIDVKGLRVTGGNIEMLSQGGAAALYLTASNAAERAALVDRITKTFEGVEGYSSVVPPTRMSEYGVADASVDPRAPDMLLFAKMGCIFGDTAAGDLPFREKPERKGSHGHDPNFPELHATFIASGVGIKPGVNLGAISNIDVAPTLAQLLSVPLPDTDGKPLRAALTAEAAAAPATP